VNGQFMVKRPYHIFVPEAHRDTTVGYAYVAEVTSEYRSNYIFQWKVTLPSLVVHEFKPSVTTPDSLQVTAPIGGNVYSRTKGFPLRWSYSGEVKIVLSSYDPLTRTSRPLMMIRPPAGAQEVVVGKKILKLLPSNTWYVVSFIVANRNIQQVTLRNSSVNALSQAAVVHNTFVQIY
jgi:hypothetical protein